MIYSFPSEVSDSDRETSFAVRAFSSGFDVAMIVGAVLVAAPAITVSFALRVPDPNPRPCDEELMIPPGQSPDAVAMSRLVNRLSSP